MRIIKIKVNSRYKKFFRNFPFAIQAKSVEKINIFVKNAFDSQLRTHFLSGKDKECWAFWIDYHYRIKFIFLSDGEVLFLHIGTHDIYK